MESVITLVVLAVVYSVVFLIKALAAKNAGVDAKPLSGEPFPEIEVLEPSDDAETLLSTLLNTAAPVAADGTKDKYRTPPQTKQQIISNSARRTTVSPKAHSPSVPEENANPIKINCKSEAKRAFIYSEIFNRKY